MENQIRAYVREELAKLSSENRVVNLTGVYPSLLEIMIDGFDWSEADTNGWQLDYWLETDKYEISGCAYYGKATIELKG
ncbi:hypothetical protein Kirov_191 [Bacillus phage Kirov]|uniref:Phage protein n=1 Tax=Bacillus phage Kirov TaxID=2783539 RepID=A0A7U3RZ25_9CAUD|nr:hypothetical protein PQE67_gp113 [Bacillus phage Kirov]QOV08390.1 hypothetical protein Kirov_191 [Bacillus phage Kirov]